MKEHATGQCANCSWNLEVQMNGFVTSVQVIQHVGSFGCTTE